MQQKGWDQEWNLEEIHHLETPLHKQLPSWMLIFMQKFKITQQPIQDEFLVKETHNLTVVYLRAKTQNDLITYSGNVGDQRILQCNWLAVMFDNAHLKRESQVLPFLNVYIID